MCFCKAGGLPAAPLTPARPPCRFRDAFVMGFPCVWCTQDARPLSSGSALCFFPPGKVPSPPPCGLTGAFNRGASPAWAPGHRGDHRMKAGQPELSTPLATASSPGRDPGRKHDLWVFTSTGLRQESSFEIGGWHTFPIKGQVVNILGPLGHIIFVVITLSSKYKSRHR